MVSDHICCVYLFDIFMSRKSIMKNKNIYQLEIQFKHLQLSIFLR